MPVNKETHKIVPVIIPNEIEKEVSKAAKENDRSRSAQILTYIKKCLKEEKK